LTTVGYANAASLFVLKQFLPSLLHYARMLPVLLLPVIVASAPFSLLLARRHPSTVAACWAWIVAYAGFYAFYYASSESWFILRYIMPAMVALTAAAILVLSSLERWLVDRRGKPQWAGGLPLALAVAAILYGAWQGNRLHAYDFKRNESNILEVVDWIERSTSADDVFLCFQFSGSLHYYTDRALLRHDQLTAESWQKLSKATRDGPDVFGVFYVFEFSDGAVIGSRFDGDWEETFKTRDSVIRVFRLNRPKAPAPG
jgi:hypothetical protein